MEEKKNHTLEVPIYVSLERELVAGLSLKSFVFSVLSTVLVGVFILIKHIAFGGSNPVVNIITLFTVYFLATTFLTKSKSTHLCLLDLVRILIKFKNEQQYYPFIFKR